MQRLFIFETHPVQYHAPVYRELHEICTRQGGAEMRVIYATDGSLRGQFDPGFGREVAWDEPLVQGYPATILKTDLEPAPGTGAGFRKFRGTGVWAAIREGRPTAILLTRLNYEFDLAAYLAGLLFRIPIWMRMETQDEAVRRSPLKSWARAAAYRLAYAPVARAFPIGKLNAAHYQRHGVPAGRHVASPYCVVDRFSGWTPLERESQRETLRARLQLDPETVTLLFCGKLQAKKNPMILLEALEAMDPAQRARHAVLYVGTGELEGALRARAAAIPNARVVFAGFKNQTELAPWYLAADVVVLPSQQMGETWGLVVNEALLAERRVIVSRHAGCHAEFSCLPSVRVFDGTLTDFQRALAELPGPESTAGQRSFMERYSVAAAARGLAAGLGLAPDKQGRAVEAVSQDFLLKTN